MTHRGRTVAAVERFMARRAPAGYWPVDQRWPHVVVAGAALFCCRCDAEGRAPLPKAEGYGAAVEAWLREHKGCEPERRS